MARRKGQYHQIRPCGDKWLRWHCVHCEKYFHRKPLFATCVVRAKGEKNAA